MTPSQADRRDVLRLSLGGVVATIAPLPARAASPATAPILLEALPGTQRLVPAPAAVTAIWGYGGTVPGPLLRLKLGETVKVRLVNKLAQPTSITWHGVRIINAMDGVAGLTQPPVRPGERFDYTFTPPDAGLYWYHPHVAPEGAEQTGRGLYGVLIVDERDPPKVDRDLLVVLDDWLLDDKAQIKGGFLDPATASPAGRIGPLVTLGCNPLPATDEVRPGARIRLRLLNACTARVCVVSFVDAPAHVIAIDGQPSEIFEPMRATVPIGPGARFEVMLDLPAVAGKAATVLLRGDGEPDRTLMILTTKGEPLPAAPPLAKLPANPLLPTRIPLERSLRRDIIIDAAAPGGPWLWTINGVGSNGVSGKPLFSVARGAVVTLTIVNKTAFVQQIHVHGHVWRLLHDLDDGWDPYWRDCVLLAPGKTKHVAFIADNPGKWALGSSILDRQETGMATWFQVT